MNLYEEYRPKTLDEIVGHGATIAKTRKILERGWGGRAWWISGASGTGKTTIARIIADQGADGMFVNEYKAGDNVNMSDVRTMERCMWFGAGGKGGRAFIINEAHGLNRAVMRYLLGVLEEIPKRCCFIFTTTAIAQKNMFDEKIDTSPLLSRCVQLELKPDHLPELFAAHCKAIAVKEGLNGRPIQEFVKLALRCKSNCREMLMRIEAGEMIGE